MYPLNTETDWTPTLLHKTDVHSLSFWCEHRGRVFVSVACFMRCQLAFTNHGQIEFSIYLWTTTTTKNLHSMQTETQDHVLLGDRHTRDRDRFSQETTTKRWLFFFFFWRGHPGDRDILSCQLTRRRQKRYILIRGRHSLRRQRQVLLRCDSKKRGSVRDNTQGHGLEWQRHSVAGDTQGMFC